MDPLFRNGWWVDDLEWMYRGVLLDILQEKNLFH